MDAQDPELLSHRANYQAYAQLWQVSAWFDAEENSSNAYTVSKSFYESWFANREARIVQEINLATSGGAGNSYYTSFTVTTPGGGSTAANTINLVGTAPSGVYSVVVDGQSGTSQTWTNQTTWNLSGVLLQAGLNTFTLRALDASGNALALATYTITKTGNAPPVMRIATNSGSWNAPLGQPPRSLLPAALTQKAAPSLSSGMPGRPLV
jgi:hypothetical protein